MQTDATTPSIVGPTMLGVVVSVFAEVCKRIEQLPVSPRPKAWSQANNVASVCTGHGQTNFQLTMSVIGRIEFISRPNHSIKS